MTECSQIAGCVRPTKPAWFIQKRKFRPHFHSHFSPLFCSTFVLWLADGWETQSFFTWSLKYVRDNAQHHNHNEETSRESWWIEMSRHFSLVAHSVLDMKKLSCHPPLSYECLHLNDLFDIAVYFVKGILDHFGNQALFMLTSKHASVAVDFQSLC